MSETDDKPRYESGDKCPDCRRGRLTNARPRQAFRLICPRCCKSIY